MPWFASEFRDAMTSRRRAIAWRCTTDRRLEVRHCGHPTALRPYYVTCDGRSLLDELGTFRVLEEAQRAAVAHLEAKA